MSADHVNPPTRVCPPPREELTQQLHQRLDEIIAFCRRDPGPASFLDFEKTLLGRLRSLGCLLIQLFLLARQARLDLTTWTQTRGYRVADDAAERTLKTSCGEVLYHRGRISCPAAAVDPACIPWMWSWA